MSSIHRHMCEKKQETLDILHIYVAFAIEVGHCELENLMIYSFSLWYILRDTPSKYVVLTSYNEVVGILYRTCHKKVGSSCLIVK